MYLVKQVHHAIQNYQINSTDLDILFLIQERLHLRTSIWGDTCKYFYLFVCVCVCELYLERGFAYWETVMISSLVSHSYRKFMSSSQSLLPLVPKHHLCLFLAVCVQAVSNLIK